MNCSTPGLPVHYQLPEFTQTHVLCRLLLLLPPIPPSIRVFSNESILCMRWPKYWSFIFSIIPSKEHPGPISFRMDWLDLLAVQGTLKNLLQYHSWKASILFPKLPALFQALLLMMWTVGNLNQDRDTFSIFHKIFTFLESKFFLGPVFHLSSFSC